jgi:hypothetical protein
MRVILFEMRIGFDIADLRSTKNDSAGKAMSSERCEDLLDMRLIPHKGPEGNVSVWTHRGEEKIKNLLNLKI